MRSAVHSSDIISLWRGQCAWAVKGSSAQSACRRQRDHAISPTCTQTRHKPADFGGHILATCADGHMYLHHSPLIAVDIDSRGLGVTDRMHVLDTATFERMHDRTAPVCE